MHLEDIVTTAVLAARAAVSVLLPRQALDTSPTQSQMKPHGDLEQYRKYVTGNLNGTTLIVPIPLTRAREILPKEYEFLDGAAWQSMLPDFPSDKYPLMVTAVYDHDVGSKGYGVSTSDFHRASFEFPFVDRLGDRYSAFRWTGTMMITANHIAVRGARLYGITAIPSLFEPLNDAYAGESDGEATFYAESKAEQGKSMLSIRSWPHLHNIPYPIEFIRNVTNQPTFGGPRHCDRYIRLFNTSLTENDAFAPVPVTADIKAQLAPVTASEDAVEYRGVYGWRLSTAFVEPIHPWKCDQLAGYAGTGPGDSSPPGPPKELRREPFSSDEMR
ncbi:hypothetical protein JDV02_008253 [Purpureocillium takamizusanense]|uniref:Acetoacetate decarboxylase n=1 Tax=Purpureocillium takamizusanense TaxID=2060973 RepID=A0A9Q8QPW2_9HYPO|nr:uncharacterized protein JDV02_008253 [Purpureocillium takamizusanense]UNI22357.1 hypothetical protein JDV02_008253 [Purpureocillium takamizusanense]